MDFVKGITKKLPSVFSGRSLLILAVAAIFVVVAVYVYRTYIVPRIFPAYVPNKEFTAGDGGATEQEAELYLFYTEWCPHCKSAKPIWYKLKETYDGNKINNTKIYFKEVDCDKDEATADKFKVEGYPTIKLVKGDQVIEYDAKPDFDTLKDFLHSTL